MVSRCCLKVIAEELEKAGVKVDEIVLGRAVISYNPANVTLRGSNGQTSR